MIKLYHWIIVLFLLSFSVAPHEHQWKFFLGKRSTHLMIFFCYWTIIVCFLFCRFVLRECEVEVIRPLFLPPEVTSFRCRRLLRIISGLSRIAWNWDVRDIYFMPPIWSFPLGIDDSWFHFALDVGGKNLLSSDFVIVFLACFNPVIVLGIFITTLSIWRGYPWKLIQLLPVEVLSLDPENVVISNVLRW